MLDELVADGRRGARGAPAAPRTSPPCAVRGGARTATATPGWWRCSSSCAAAGALLYERFLELWQEYERKGFRARLEYAVCASGLAMIHDAEP